MVDIHKIKYASHICLRVVIVDFNFTIVYVLTKTGLDGFCPLLPTPDLGPSETPEGHIEKPRIESTPLSIPTIISVGPLRRPRF